jgi:hypothetical protein
LKLSIKYIILNKLKDILLKKGQLVMEGEVKSFINLIKEKTGISIDYEEVMPENLGAVNPFSDEAKGKTFFVVKDRQNAYCFSLIGATEVEKTYANLILELAENSFFKEGELSLLEFYKGALYGELAPVKLRKYVNKFGIPEMPCYAMIITCEKGSIEDVDSVILGYGDNQNDFLVGIEKNRAVLVKYVDENSGDYRSSREYAEYLIRSVYEETGADLTIAVGGIVDDIYSLAKSCAQAFTVLRMKQAVSFRGKVNCYNEYTLYKILKLPLLSQFLLCHM